MYGRLVQARRQQPEQAGKHLCRLASRLLEQVCLPGCARLLQLQQPLCVLMSASTCELLI